MAEQKFLGQAGTDVLVEKIKSAFPRKVLTIDDLGEDAQFLINPHMFYFPVTIKQHESFPDVFVATAYDGEITIESVMDGVYFIHMINGFYATVSGYAHTGSFMDGIVRCAQELDTDTGALKGTIVGRVYPAPIYIKQQQIEEITAQEVSDKFNS